MFNFSRRERFLESFGDRRPSTFSLRNESVSTLSFTKFTSFLFTNYFQCGKEPESSAWENFWQEIEVFGIENTIFGLWTNALKNFGRIQEGKRNFISGFRELKSTSSSCMTWDYWTISIGLVKSLTNNKPLILLGGSIDTTSPKCK